MIKKEQILEKALELFNEKGYPEVGVRELARTLSISPGNLSYHFRKKDDILLALLEQLGAQNSGYYEWYSATPPSNKSFLELMHKIFSSQFDYRGVYIGNQIVQAELQSRGEFDYPAIVAKRTATFRNIFKDLDADGQISVSEEDIIFMVSHLTLFGRFWISEATLFNKSPDKDKTIRHYVSLLSKQLSLFATEKGKESIKEFRNSFL